MFSPYPDTQQFRHVVTQVRQYGHHRNEEPPTLKFVGTVKLHGCNTSIGYQKDSEHWFQSRHGLLKPEKNFPSFASSLAQKLLTEFVLPQSPVIREHYESGRKILIFGEWCGGSIQKHVALFGLPEMFVIFNVRICDVQVETTAKERSKGKGMTKTATLWLHPRHWSHIKWHEKSIYNIYDFQTYELDIDFQRPDLAQNKLVEITQAVEMECPVGKYFNQIGIGEGVIWTEWETSNGNWAFKVKGDKHTVCKVVTLAAVDTEKFDRLIDFIDYACTENRMQQGLDYLRDELQMAIEWKSCGVFIKWIVGDILKEERDTMDASCISVSDVSRGVSSKARVWFQYRVFSGT